MSDYKKTLNLPQTAFPMKANLAQREPETLRKWDQIHAREVMVDASGSRGVYVLHDGPPYANGPIHIGHSFNKIIKDFEVFRAKLNLVSIVGQVADYRKGGRLIPARGRWGFLGNHLIHVIGPGQKRLDFTLPHCRVHDEVACQ